MLKEVEEERRSVPKPKKVGLSENYDPAALFEEKQRFVCVGLCAYVLCEGVPVCGCVCVWVGVGVCVCACVCVFVFVFVCVFVCVGGMGVGVGSQ